MKLLNNKKLLLGLGLGTIVATVPVALTMSCGCSLKDRYPGLFDPTNPDGDSNPDKDPDNNDGNGKPESNPSLDSDNINNIITEIPKENIVNGKLQLFSYASLVKYAAQLPRIKNLSVEQMRQKYVDLKKYATKFRIKAKECWTDFRTSPIAPGQKPLGQDVWDDFDFLLRQEERIFFNENDGVGTDWLKTFADIVAETKVENVIAYTFVFETYIQAMANEQVGSIIESLCDYKIALIDLKSQLVSNDGKNIIKNNSKIKIALKNLAQQLYLFFNPIQAKPTLQLGDSGKYFLGPVVFNDFNNRISDNPIGLKYLILLANQEVGPLVEWYLLNSSSDFSCPNSFDKPPVYKMNGGNGYRDLVKAINRHTGQTIKWYGEFGTEQNINAWFRKWFSANKQLYGWNIMLNNMN